MCVLLAAVLVNGPLIICKRIAPNLNYVFPGLTSNPSTCRTKPDAHNKMKLLKQLFEGALLLVALTFSARASPLDLTGRQAATCENLKNKRPQDKPCRLVDGIPQCLAPGRQICGGVLCADGLFCCNPLRSTCAPAHSHCLADSHGGW